MPILPIKPCQDRNFVAVTTRPGICGSGPTRWALLATSYGLRPGPIHLVHLFFYRTLVRAGMPILRSKSGEVYQMYLRSIRPPHFLPAASQTGDFAAIDFLLIRIPGVSRRLQINAGVAADVLARRSRIAVGRHGLRKGLA